MTARAERHQFRGWISIGTLARSAGIPVETIRTWERRYGSPRPRRLSSGHRRYDPAEIERLGEVRDLIELGHRASSIVSMSLEELRTLGPSRPSVEALPEGEVQGQLMIAVEQMNSTDLAALLNRTWDEYGALSFIEDICGPLLNRIGRGWQTGQLTVAQEHFASEQIVHLLSQRWRAMQPSVPKVKLVFATVPNERHFLGLHMAAVAASLYGAGVVWLGPDSPLNDIAQAATRHQTASVVLSLSIWEQEQRSASVRRLRQLLCPTIGLVVGGTGAPMTMDDVHYIGDFRGFADYVRSMVARNAIQAG